MPARCHSDKRSTLPEASREGMGFQHEARPSVASTWRALPSNVHLYHALPIAAIVRPPVRLAHDMNPKLKASMVACMVRSP
jgi:hypothetical protein